MICILLSSLYVHDFYFLDGKRKVCCCLCVLWCSEEARRKRSVEMFVIVLRDYTGYSHEVIGILALCSDLSAIQFHFYSAGDDVSF